MPTSSMGSSRISQPVMRNQNGRGMGDTLDMKGLPTVVSIP